MVPDVGSLIMQWLYRIEPRGAKRRHMACEHTNGCKDRSDDNHERRDVLRLDTEPMRRAFHFDQGISPRLLTQLSGTNFRRRSCRHAVIERL